MSSLVKEKKINNRKFPGIKGPRPDRKLQKRKEATERNAIYQALSLEQQAQRNPKKFEAN